MAVLESCMSSRQLSQGCIWSLAQVQLAPFHRGSWSLIYAAELTPPCIPAMHAPMLPSVTAEETTAQPFSSWATVYMRVGSNQRARP